MPWEEEKVAAYEGCVELIAVELTAIMNDTTDSAGGVEAQ